MAAGERGTQRQNREDGKRPLPISPAAFQVDELRQFRVANIRHLPRLTLDHPALTVRVDRKIFEDADHTKSKVLFGVRRARQPFPLACTQSR